MSSDTLHKMMDNGFIQAVGRYVKSCLTEKHRHDHLYFCLYNVKDDGYFDGFIIGFMFMNVGSISIKKLYFLHCKK